MSHRTSHHTGCGVTRRSFLVDTGMGFTGMAIASMLAGERSARASSEAWLPPDGQPHFAPKAKSVIWLFMLGGVSHLEGFDPKPAITKYGGKLVSETPFNVLNNPAINNARDFAVKRARDTRILPLQVGFRKHGQLGVEVSDWFPHMASLVDDMAIVRSVWTTDNDHAAQYQFHTGRHVFDGSHPSIGSWVKYGLGTLNDNLPQFVALGDPPGVCCGGVGAQNASYLGPEHNAIQLSSDPKNPLAYSTPGSSVSREEHHSKMQLLGELNQLSADLYPDDPAVKARIKSYELAFHMQSSVPAVFNYADEDERTRKMYGLDSPVTRPFGERCLTARRLVEGGVRWVQLYHGDGKNSFWDAHAELKKNHETHCPQVDQPIAALIKDLKQRGMLDETLVVFASEFGRTPGLDPFNMKSADGRDHHPFGFTILMAGGGLKRGIVHGATDELGYHAVENRHYVTDIHATILHQLGLDPRRLEVPGRKRLEIDFGTPIYDIIA